MQNIALIPQDCPVIGLMRHAEREKIPKGKLGNELHITQQGIDDTIKLHSYLKNRLIEIYASPVLRCIETAELLKCTAKYAVVKQNRMLGDPGVFVENPEIASPFFLKYEAIEVVARLLNKKSVMPGFCLSVEEAFKKLLNHLFSLANETGIYLFITHDSILGAVNGILFPNNALVDVWPGFLETLFLYKKSGLVYAVFRGQKTVEGKPAYVYE
ncbi:MAG TPA: histidine phosphatase family protein [Gammaproteobacteria bacterium]|nr:histidine phosphatase family protein [Gammaproteobacteria bacterium]